MKKVYEAPRIEGQEFVANEYIAACGYVADKDTWLYFNLGDAYVPGVAVKDNAYKRTANGIPNYTQDDILDTDNPKPIYWGSFYRDKECTIGDATNWGHVEKENGADLECCQDIPAKSPFGYHYHFAEVNNHS